MKTILTRSIARELAEMKQTTLKPSNVVKSTKTGQRTLNIVIACLIIGTVIAVTVVSVVSPSNSY